MKHTRRSQILLASVLFFSNVFTSIAFNVSTQRRVLYSTHDPYEMKAQKNDDQDEKIFPPRSKSKKSVPKITTIQGLTEFLDFLAEIDDRIVVVEFYAEWCKSCHRFGAKYKQLAYKYADKINENGDIVEDGKVRFAQVEYGANVRLCKTFGIKKLPFVQMYKAPLGKISEFICGPKHFDERLKGRLEEYLKMSDDEIKFSRDMEEGQALNMKLLQDTKEMEREVNSTGFN